MDLVEEEEAATVVAITITAAAVTAAAATEAAATEAAVMVVAITITAAAVTAAAVTEEAVTEEAATAAVILDLIALTQINPLEQKVGKTEVMEILLKTLNMKMVGAGEKGECLTRVMLQVRQISNPSLQALSLI